MLDIFLIGHILGYVMIGLITLIGIRFLFYFQSFFLRWSHYRNREVVTTDDLKHQIHIPFIKIQVTTRGSVGSTEVIRRGISYVMLLAREDWHFYSHYISIEIVTESETQKHILEHEFSGCPVAVQAIVIPEEYQSPYGTQLKARGLQYMVELRRRGLNRKPGRTVIVHYDEESVMAPVELRRLLMYLTHTDKKLTEGPIYYPLEYFNANLLCRAVEANRPIGCFECRAVMQKGIPLHLHGSNLVIDEDLENDVGWDIGTLDGQPFIAEDYVFGVRAYLRYGSSIFGWNGCVMLEQPPFSLKSAFRQRYRWIIGILQGISMMKRQQAFHRLPWRLRMRLTFGTLYRVATFALGLPTGAISLLYILYQAVLLLLGQFFSPLPFPLLLWMILIGFLWLNSIVIGAWYNVTAIYMIPPLLAVTEVAAIIAIAPISGILESAAAFWAVVQWGLGKRKVAWKPTPKTVAADKLAVKESM